MALWPLLDAAFRRFPGRTALVDIGRYRSQALTYAGLDVRVRQCQALFGRLGLRRGDRLLIWGMNSSSWAAALLACLRSGIIAVPLDIGSTPAFVRAVQRETKAKALFTDRPPPRGIRTVRLDGLPQALATIPPDTSAPAPAGDDDLAEIVYTSGTTGEPKGVILTHGNLAANLAPLRRLVWLPRFFRFASILPLSHMTEQMLGLLLPLASGASIHYLPSIQPERLAEAIRLKGIHAMMAVPGILELLRGHLERHHLTARQAFGWQFRLLGVGGAPLDPGLERWWRRQGMLVVQGYGLTETGPLIALNTLTRQKAGTVGQPLPGVRVRIAEDGEIQAAGPNTTPGYYQKPGKTRALFQDGWLRTGDLGRLEHGYLRILGRTKDMIKTPAGLAVYPDDVERELNAVPGVRASCVLERHGRIHAVLILLPGTKPEQVVSQANARLAVHQRVAAWSLWPEPDFPRTPTLKVRRFQVAEALSRHRQVPAARHASRLHALIASTLHARKVRASDRLTALGMDSLRRAELLTALEAEFGVELEEDALGERTTVGQLESLLERQAPIQCRAFPLWPYRTPARILRAALQLLAGGILRLFCSPRCIGTERLARLPGPVILAVNHQSVLDAPAVTRCLPKRFRRIAIPALAEYVFGIPPPPNPAEAFRRRLTGFFSALLYGAYPLGPAIGIERAMRFTGHLLDTGTSILIFPEGHRTRHGEVRPFEPGVGFMAAEMGVPVVPVRLRGLFEAMPAGRWLPRFGRSSVTFGEPITFKPGTSYAAAARMIERAVKAL
jgi:long-chain acyl-CoA synthetase